MSILSNAIIEFNRELFKLQTKLYNLKAEVGINRMHTEQLGLNDFRRLRDIEEKRLYLLSKFQLPEQLFNNNNSLVKLEVNHLTGSIIYDSLNRFYFRQEFYKICISINTVLNLVFDSSPVYNQFIIITPKEYRLIINAISDKRVINTDDLVKVYEMLEKREIVNV